MQSKTIVRLAVAALMLMTAFSGATAATAATTGTTTDVVSVDEPTMLMDVSLDSYTCDDHKAWRQCPPEEDEP